jgi:hypothetical protein
LVFTQLLGVRVGNGEDTVAHPTFADLRVAALPVFPCFSLYFLLSSGGLRIARADKKARGGLSPGRHAQFW